MDSTRIQRRCVQSRTGSRAENPFRLHVWRLCLALISFFPNHRVYHHRILQDTPSTVFLDIFFKL